MTLSSTSTRRVFFDVAVRHDRERARRASIGQPNYRHLEILAMQTETSKRIGTCKRTWYPQHESPVVRSLSNREKVGRKQNPTRFTADCGLLEQII